MYIIINKLIKYYPTTPYENERELSDLIGCSSIRDYGVGWEDYEKSKSTVKTLLHMTLS